LAAAGAHPVLPDTGRGWLRNGPEMWTRADGAFPAIIERDLFAAAQTIVRARSARLSDEEMLNALRALFQTRGMLSGLIIDEREEMPSSCAYRRRFGGLLRAYSLVGCGAALAHTSAWRTICFRLQRLCNAERS